jgi:hypothetical protein
LSALASSPALVSALLTNLRPKSTAVSYTLDAIGIVLNSNSPDFLDAAPQENHTGLNYRQVGLRRIQDKQFSRNYLSGERSAPHWQL